MRKGLKLTLGCVAAAALIGGNAVAECAEFDGAIPTTIVTQYTTVPGDYDHPIDAMTENYLFRFSDPFTLMDYINPGTENASDLRFLFTESDPLTPGTPLTGAISTTGKTLTINGNAGEDTVPTIAEILANGESVMTGVEVIRNEGLSPSSLEDDEHTTAPSAGDLADAGERIVTIYIAGTQAECDGTTPLVNDFTSFTVITTDLGADGLSGGFTFTPIESYGTGQPNDFEGWVRTGAGGSYSPSPATTPAPAGTTSLSLTGAVATTAGLASWARVLVNGTGADQYVRARATINSNAPRVADGGAPGGERTDQMWMRVRHGNTFKQIDGQSLLFFDGASSSSSAPNEDQGDVELTNWLYSKAANVQAGGTETVWRMEVLDNSATRGHTYTLNRLILDATDRASLSGTVVRNFGGAVSGDDGVTPPASPAAFTDEDASGIFRFRPNVGTGAPTITKDFNANYLGLNITSNDPTNTGNPFWADLDTFTLSESSLLVFDVYISAPTGTNLTDLRLRLSPDATVPFNQGVAYEYEFDLRDDTVTGNAAHTGGITVGGNARRFTAIAQPANFDALQTNTEFFLFMEFLFLTGSNRNANGNIRVERYVATEVAL